MADFPLVDGLAAAAERFLWHASERTAVLSDLHLGAETELTRRGILMPDISSRAMKSAWKTLCGRLAGPRPSRLIIAGDLFDVPAPDAASVAAALSLLKSLPASCRITLIPGNHDPAPDLLTEMFAGAGVTLAAAATVGGYTVIHGHQLQDAAGIGAGQWADHPPRWIPERLIVGHQHPAVTLGNRIQSAKMICFATCKIDYPRPLSSLHTRLIVLPPFSRAPLGSNLSAPHWILDLPYPAETGVEILGIVDAKGGQVLDFGTLASLRGMR